jgi:hypothetical protein
MLIKVKFYIIFSAVPLDPLIGGFSKCSIGGSALA